MESDEQGLDSGEQSVMFYGSINGLNSVLGMLLSESGDLLVALE